MSTHAELECENLRWEIEIKKATVRNLDAQTQLTLAQAAAHAQAAARAENR